MTNQNFQINVALGLKSNQANSLHETIRHIENHSVDSSYPFNDREIIANHPVKIDLAGLIDDEINMSLSEIVEDIRYIKLESKTGSFINRISKIALSENCYYTHSMAGT